jgi:V8-like Glu-specific endopeptidase
MKHLVSAKLLLLSSALTFVACSPAKMDSVSGANNDSIINGTEVEANDPVAAVTVAIIGATKDAEGKVEQFSCTGSLVDKNAVLTAAHCVPVAPEGGDRMAVIVFNRSLKTATKADVRQVTKFAIHSKYGTAKEGESDHDYGMLQFEGDIAAGYQIASYLPGKDYNKIEIGHSVVVAGYGLYDDATQTPSDVLRKGEVKVAGGYGDAEIVFDQSTRKGVCSGDSGGPAFYEVKGKLYVFGVASRVVGPTKESYCSQYSVHGLVGANVDFIVGTLKTWAAENKAATPKAPAKLAAAQ